MLRPRTWWHEVLGVLLLSILGAGMMLNSTRSLWRGLRAHHAEFERTPKWGLIGRQTQPRRSIYQTRRDRLVVVEIALALWNFYSVFLAWHTHNPGIFLNSLVFGFGLSLAALVTMWEMRVDLMWLRRVDAESTIVRQT
jgi:hypothetical protein